MTLNSPQQNVHLESPQKLSPQKLQAPSTSQNDWPSKRPISVRWRSLFVKTTVWLSAEIILGVMGLDQLADYSEFILQRHTLMQVTETIAHIISSV